MITTYLVGAASAVVMCSVALVYILVKFNMININSLATIGASTVTGSLFLPVIKEVFLKLSAIVSVLFAVVVSSILFLLFVFFVSCIVSNLMMDKDISFLLTDMKIIYRDRLMEWSGFSRLICRVKKQVNMLKQCKLSTVSLGSVSFSTDIVFSVEHEDFHGSKKNEYSKQIMYFEKVEPVCMESQRMPAGYGAKVDQSESIEHYIEKAFDLKEMSAWDEAILNYMYALDFKPDKKLAEWMVVEICSAYKEMEQPEKIKKFLSDLFDTYGIAIDKALINEIEKSIY